MTTVTQQMGEFVRDNGGNAWDALNVALARLDLANTEVERLRAGLLRLQDDMDDETADKVQCLIDNVEYTEDDDDLG